MTMTTIAAPAACARRAFATSEVPPPRATTTAQPGICAAFANAVSAAGGSPITTGTGLPSASAGCEVAALAVWFSASAVVPVLVDTVGWKYAFAFLAPGPALGI